MADNYFGPASSDAPTTRPTLTAEVARAGSPTRWLAPCTSPGAGDGTRLTAEWGDVLIANLEAVRSASGVGSPTVTPGADDVLLEAIRALIRAAPGLLLRTTVYTRVGSTQYVQVDGGAPTTTGAGSFTALSGTTWAEVEVQAGGGGASGCPATDASSESAAGGGGGGAWARKRCAAPLSAITVTVGEAGTGGAAGPNNGANGGASSFGALVSALGGAGGAPAGPTTIGTFVALPGAGGGVGTSGDLNLPGVVGSAGTVAGHQGVPMVGAPGRSLGGYWGTGGAPRSSTTSTAAIAGADGVAGIIIVREYA